MTVGFARVEQRPVVDSETFRSDPARAALPGVPVDPCRDVVDPTFPSFRVGELVFFGTAITYGIRLS